MSTLDDRLAALTAKLTPEPEAPPEAIVWARTFVDILEEAAEREAERLRYPGSSKQWHETKAFVVECLLNPRGVFSVHERDVLHRVWESICAGESLAVVAEWQERLDRSLEGALTLSLSRRAT